MPNFASSVDQIPKRSAEEAVALRGKLFRSTISMGGITPYGYDCSGFSYNMLKACGYIIPRDAGDQAKSGEEISIQDPSVWKIGDLLFFANDEGTRTCKACWVLLWEWANIAFTFNGKNSRNFNVSRIRVRK